MESSEQASLAEQAESLQAHAAVQNASNAMIDGPLVEDASLAKAQVRSSGETSDDRVEAGGSMGSGKLSHLDQHLVSVDGQQLQNPAYPAECVGTSLLPRAADCTPPVEAPTDPGARTGSQPHQARAIPGEWPLPEWQDGQMPQLPFSVISGEHLQEHMQQSPPLGHPSIAHMRQHRPQDTNNTQQMQLHQFRAHHQLQQQTLRMQSPSQSAGRVRRQELIESQQQQLLQQQQRRAAHQQMHLIERQRQHLAGHRLNAQHSRLQQLQQQSSPMGLHTPSPQQQQQHSMSPIQQAYTQWQPNSHQIQLQLQQQQQQQQLHQQLQQPSQPTDSRMVYNSMRDGPEFDNASLSKQQLLQPLHWRGGQQNAGTAQSNAAGLNSGQNSPAMHTAAISGMKQDIHTAVAQARQAAEHATHQAARIAAIGGLQYSPSADNPFTLPRQSPQTNVALLERKLVAIEQQRAKLASEAHEVQMAMKQLLDSSSAGMTDQQQRALQHQRVLQQQRQLHPQLQHQLPHQLLSHQHPSHQIQTPAYQQPHIAHQNGSSAGGNSSFTIREEEVPAPARAERKSERRAALERKRWIEKEAGNDDDGDEDEKSLSHSTPLPPKGRSSAAKTTSAKAAKAAAAAAQAAADAAPDDILRLKLRDVKASLQGKWLQVYWPDDKRWWRGQVASISLHNIKLLYETNEEEDLDIAELISKGEVAWLHNGDARARPQPLGVTAHTPSRTPMATVRDHTAGAMGRANRNKRKAPPDFLGDGCEDDLDAVAGAAEASLMAEGCYVPASSLEEEPFGQQQHMASEPFNSSGVEAILEPDAAAEAQNVSLQWRRNGEQPH